MKGGEPVTNESAGILIYHRKRGALHVLLVHPGSPYWRGRDAGAWQIPKGGIEAGENVEAAARRETEEELGIAIASTLVPLGSLRQAGGKIVTCFGAEQDIDPSIVTSNRFDMEWPPKSGRLQSFPEIDEARWFTLGEAQAMMLPSQLPFLARLKAQLADD